MTDKIRPNWDEYFLNVAKAVSARGDCTRRQVGAVIVDFDKRIVSTGYNGSYPGGPSCLAGQCPRGKHYPVRTMRDDRTIDEYCACGNAFFPCPDAVPPGSSYDTGPGACHALHAEQNALLYAFRDVAGMTMYLTDTPCDGCMKLLHGARLGRIVAPHYELVNAVW